jgi:phytoene dehydrogenase-like protein
VTFRHDGSVQTIQTRLVISGASRTTLHQLTGTTADTPAVEGCQVKVNLLLSRLPALRDPSVTTEEAFSGTFHINESARQLEASIAQARSGVIPESIPCEIYCHSLSDPSILGPELQDSGAHTMTVFALNVPHRLIAGMDADKAREMLQEKVLASLNSVLAEPIEDCVMSDAQGKPCIETKTTADLEHTLGLPGGNIFHEPLQWPFVEDPRTLLDPASKWGVQSGVPHVLLGGASARRGGGVSGIAGHNAAMAALEILGGP